MPTPIFQVDAFADRVFAGNPAAVCPLEAWLPDHVMQAIATENNLSETVFTVPVGEGYAIRWFTPVAEIDLAGHPTLAAAYIILNRLQPGRDAVTFESRYGDHLTVSRDDRPKADGRLVMDFPSRLGQPGDGLGDVATALGAKPTEVLERVQFIPGHNLY